MAVMTEALPASGLRTLYGNLDVAATPESTFALLCAVEKWPVWLSFIRSARLADPKNPLAIGSDVIIRSALPGDEEQHFEVDQYIENHHISLVGAYSIRRRIDFRVERRMLTMTGNGETHSRIHIRIMYPPYNGWLGAALDRITHARKIAAALDHSLVLFRGLAEYNREPDEILADF